VRDTQLQVVGLAAVVVFFAAGLAALIVGISAGSGIASTRGCCEWFSARRSRSPCGRR
jgi:hypothetical protein